MDIAEKCYFLTKEFPKDELYGMVQQIRKSAVSIPGSCLRDMEEDPQLNTSDFLLLRARLMN